jgi:mannose-6-phosphate isomerase-like protein (cupin superfamily)
MTWKLIAPRRAHSDERREGYYDVFPPTVREVNVTQINPHQSAGDWHRHARQVDYWMVMNGHLRVGLMVDDVSKVIRLVPGEVLMIPRGVWHTYFGTDCSPILIYGLTNKYDGTDEERLPYRECDF